MQNCPSCGGGAEDEDRFCGECGSPLATDAAAGSAQPGCVCGAPAAAIDADGFCGECGRKHGAADPRDHVELALSSNFAGVTDRGQRHKHNEDALLVAEFSSPGGAIRLMAVSDGVSSSFAPADGSQAAVDALRDAAFAALETGAGLQAALESGVAAAQAAVSVLFSASYGPAAATLVAAIVQDKQAVLAWAGDSRAYFAAPKPGLLTRDDSWMNQVVADGLISEAEARRHKFAHAITACLGRIADDEVFSPHFQPIELPDGAALILCSDGMWNYAETPEALASLLASDIENADALSLCREMAAFANRQGGHDNISVALLRLASVAPTPT